MIIYCLFSKVFVMERGFQSNSAGIPLLPQNDKEMKIQSSKEPDGDDNNRQSAFAIALSLTHS
jgi:hypothetical protein